MLNDHKKRWQVKIFLASLEQRLPAMKFSDKILILILSVQKHMDCIRDTGKIAKIVLKFIYSKVHLCDIDVCSPGRKKNKNVAAIIMRFKPEKMCANKKNCCVIGPVFSFFQSYSIAFHNKAHYSTIFHGS